LITESFSFDLLAALLRTSPAALLGPLREALAAGLVVEVGAELGAPDPLNRAVLAARADAVTRAAARDAALAHVEPEVAVPPAVAAVLAATAEPGDAAALAVLRRAVAERPSAEPAVRALELTPDHDAELLDTAAELLARADRSDDARALVQAALERGLAAPDEARARLALARLAGVEDVAEAAAQSARAAALPDLPPAVVAQVLAERALGLALIGDGPQAATVATAAVAAARAIPDPAAEATALLAASMAAFARHATDEALALGEDALRAVRRDGALPVALWVPGSCWRCLLRSASGQSAEALAEADAGLRVADDHHHAPARRLWSATRACLLPDADRLREDATTGDAPAPPTGWDALTAAELRVVEEVARGGTNRDVAEALGLSANTVGTHLRHAFAKLGVGSRVELARLAAARDRERGDS
jgi:DNA-binding CsgD family transcriptional regulator